MKKYLYEASNIVEVSRLRIYSLYIFLFFIFKSDSFYDEINISKNY